MTRMKGMKRPAAVVLPDTAAVPMRNIRPAPSRFTHEVVAPAEFWFDDAGKKAPDGTLRDGAQVAVQSRGGEYAWVTDDRGLYVQVKVDSLVPLT